MAEEILAKSQSSPDSVPLMVAHRTLGSTLLTMGEFQQARRHFERTLELSDRKGHQPLHNLYMVDPEAATLLLLSWDLWFLGFADQALARVMEGVALARNLAQPYNIAFGHYMCSVVHLLRGEPARALANAEKSLEISQEQRFALYALLSRIARGCALGELGHRTEACAEMKAGIDEARNDGVGFMRPMMLSWLAGAYARSGENETALAIVDEALEDVTDATGRSWEAELHRQKALSLLAIDPARVGEAEAMLNGAVALARRQAAKSLELRAATSLAEFWRRLGRTEAAHDLLVPLYRWFTEGLDTETLKRAQDVLRALGPISHQLAGPPS
jgi:predicted ATPase